MGKRRKNRRAERQAASLRDTGPNASGHYEPNPWSARGHTIETAPRELRANPHSNFPKRTTTQRMFDRYLAHGHITEREHQAANALWEFHHQAGLQAKVTGGYDPVMVSSSPDMGDRLAKWLDAALELTRLFRAIPYRSQGVVRAVVIEDRSAADWAKERGIGARDSKAYGLMRLRSGLSALCEHLGY